MVVDLTDGVTDPDGDPMQVANFSVSYSLANISEGIYMPLTDNDLKLKFEQVLKETNLEGNNLNIYISNSLFLTANQIGKIEMTYDITDGIYTTPVVNKVFITGKNDAPASADVVQTTTYKVDSAGSRLKDLQGNDVREEIIEGVTVMAAVEGTDPDSGDSIIYEINPEVTVSTGALEFNSDGTYSFVPEEHFYGEVTFEYFIEDSSGAKEGPYQVRIIVAENPDDDGIPTRLEALGKSTDIDGDGMPDRKQNNISHFPMTSAADFEAAKAWAPYIGGLAVIGIIYGSLGCLAQTDMKRLIAFSSVAHMGFVMLGISTLTSFGMTAAMFGMVAHGLITGMLFFIAGSIKERYHTLEIKRLGGLLKQMPHLGWIFGLCSMASLGLPGLAGFWGEFPAILSAYSPAPGLNETVFRVYMVIAAIGTVFAAAYLLWLFQRVAFGEPKPEFAGAAHGHDDHGHDHALEDVNKFEWISWTPLLIAIIVFGLMPNLLFKIIDPAVQGVLTGFKG